MSETTWIQRYIAPLVTSRGAAGLQDDVAQIRADGTIIATMDTIVEGVHFLPSDPIMSVGQKLVRVNVSDIYAKGAEPLEALISIAWPRARAEVQFADLIAGIGKDLKEFGVELIGGDLVGVEGPLSLTMTLTGRCINVSPVRRSGGAAGQALYVNGEIGWGGIGLKAARDGQNLDVAARYQVPRISSIFGAQTVADLAKASMDISDGLLIDVARLASASACGAQIQLEKVPLAEPTENIDAILAQCTAGDDYRILMCAEPDQQIPSFTQIGYLTDSMELSLTHNEQLVNTPSTLGFEH